MFGLGRAIGSPAMTSVNQPPPLLIDVSAQLAELLFARDWPAAGITCFAALADVAPKNVLAFAYNHV
jgi:hypothetical protein